MRKKQCTLAPSLSTTTLPISVPLPYELWSCITAHSLADYICNILDDGSYCSDAITVLLHLNRMSRECTLEHLYSLWGDTFVNTKSKKLSNFKPSVALIRELSIALRISSSSFHTHKLQANRAIRRPICAIVRISKLYWERSVQEAKFIHFPTMYMPRINEAIEQFPKAIELIAVERSRARGSGRDVLFGGIMEGFKKQQFRCLKVRLVSMITRGYRSSSISAQSALTHQDVQKNLAVANTERTKAVNDFRQYTKALGLEENDVCVDYAPLNVDRLRALGVTELFRTYARVEKKGGETLALLRIWKETLESVLTEQDRTLLRGGVVEREIASMPGTIIKWYRP